MSRISIDIPSADYARVKALAAKREQTLREFVLDALRRRLNGTVRPKHPKATKRAKPKMPNKTTLDTFRKTDAGKELTYHKSTADFFKSLDL